MLQRLREDAHLCAPLFGAWFGVDMLVNYLLLLSERLDISSLWRVDVNTNQRPPGYSQE